MLSFMLNKKIYKPCQYFVLCKILSGKLTQRLEGLPNYTLYLASHVRAPLNSILTFSLNENVTIYV